MSLTIGDTAPDFEADTTEGRIAFHEWQAMFGSAWHARGWRNTLATLLRPPGWSADGSTLTAKQMQRAAASSVRRPMAAG